jgi:hypothetical protein
VADRDVSLHALAYEQLAWDALVFLLFGIACARRNRGAFQATLLASVIVVPIADLAFSKGDDVPRPFRDRLGARRTAAGDGVGRSRIVALCGVAFAAKMIFE